MTSSIIHTQCCIAGGGPAGMMLGLLLARVGVQVMVLEKHADFLRDFRGDTVHPSTLEVMHELGFLEDFLNRPHQKVDHLGAMIGQEKLPLVDFSKLRVHAPYVAFMPQWDFLNFLAEKASAYPNFTLKMQTEVTGLLSFDDQVTGVQARTPDGPIDIHSNLIIGADGRHSIVRNCARLPIQDFGAPIDVLWFRISRQPEDTSETQARLLPGSMMIMINRGDYWQCAYIIRKGYFEQIQQQGLPAFRAHIEQHIPFIKNRLHEIARWSNVKLLTVKVDYLTRWYRDGLLCIGDAAHAMSPVAGVGINLAIQDAVAAANILGEAMGEETMPSAQLARVQKRRAWPTQMTQRMQLAIHKRVINRVLRANQPLKPPFMLRMMSKLPLFRRLAGRLIGIGFRAEHILR